MKGAERQAGISHCWPPGNFDKFRHIFIFIGREERECQDTQLEYIWSQDALCPRQVCTFHILQGRTKTTNALKPSHTMVAGRDLPPQQKTSTF